MRAAAVLAGLVLVVGGLLLLGRQRADVDIFNTALAKYPATVYRPRGAPPAGTVLVVHGITMNKEMMRPWGLALARRGFAAVLVDLPGHGESPLRLPAGEGQAGVDLAVGLQAVVAELVSKGMAQPGKIGLVGHSMGARAVTALASLEEQVAAVVATSGGLPAEGTPVPRNLLAMVAERDLPGLRGALDALALTTGNGVSLGGLVPPAAAPAAAAVAMAGEFDQGTARAAYLVPGRNHITIVYDSRVHTLAAAWLALGMGAPVAAAPPAPSEWGWVLAAGAGALLTFWGAAGLRPAAPAGHRTNRVVVGTSPGLLLLLLAVAALGGVLGAQWLHLFRWLGLLVADYILTFMLVMAVALGAARYLAPDEFDVIPAEYAVTTLRGALTGLIQGVVLLAALGPVINAGVSHFVPLGARLTALAVLVPGLWLYFIQEEGLAAAAGRYAAPGLARLVLALGKLVIAGLWLASSLLPGSGGLLPVILPVAAPALLLLEAGAWVLDRAGHPPPAMAAFKSLVMASIMAATFPLG